MAARQRKRIGRWMRGALAGTVLTAALVASGTARAADWFAPYFDVSQGWCTGHCAFSIFAGRRIDTAMTKTFGLEGFTAPTDYRWGDSGFVALALSRRFLSLGDYIDVEAEIGVGQRFGSLSEGEGWVALYGRWVWFPWNDTIRTTVAISTGLNLATDVPRYEFDRTGGKRAYLLHYLSPEITFASPRSPQWEVFGRLHHRSGGNDLWGDTALFKGADGGVQHWTAGIRYRF